MLKQVGLLLCFLSIRAMIERVIKRFYAIQNDF